MNRARVIFISAASIAVLSVVLVSVPIVRTLPGNQSERVKGWILPGSSADGRTELDLNLDNSTDIRAISGDTFELRTEDGWGSFRLPPTTVLTPAKVPCPPETEIEHEVLFIKADDGAIYKFCPIDDTSFSVFRGDLGNIRPHGKD